MKSIKKKYTELINEGFSEGTLNSLSEAQLTKLHGMIVKPRNQVNEQPVQTTTKQVSTTKIPPSTAKTTGANVASVDIKMDGAGNILATKMEGEMEENNSKKKTNPWAICTSTLGKKFGTTERNEWTKQQKKEYEACVTDVKKSSKKEGKKIDEQLESHIVKLLERHVSPKMSKKDLMSILEQAPMETPTKPDTRPDTKPDTEPAKRPAHPMKWPTPGKDPKPKAKGGKDIEKTKEDIMDIISKILREE